MINPNNENEFIECVEAALEPRTLIAVYPATPFNRRVLALNNKHFVQYVAISKEHFHSFLRKDIYDKKISRHIYKHLHIEGVQKVPDCPICDKIIQDYYF